MNEKLISNSDYTAFWYNHYFFSFFVNEEAN